MNILQKIISGQDSAIARWRQHVATVKGKIESEDRRIRETFEKLCATDRSAKELMTAEPCLENLVKSVDAGARRIAAKQAFDHYSNGAGMWLHERIQKGLDFSIAAAAVKELRRLIESKKSQALTDATKLSEDNALDATATQEAIENRFADRLRLVASAEQCLENTRNSTPDRPLIPSGLLMLNDYIEAAVG